MTHRVLSKLAPVIAFLFLLLILPSCADRDTPGAATVHGLLGTFFGAQGFKVVSVDLGQIEGAPLAQKSYGKKRAFYVTVKRVVLEKEGRQVTRENGVVVIRQKTGAGDEWEIERMPAELTP